MEHVIKNVEATLDAEGKISELAFTGSVTNGKGQEFTQDVKFSDKFAPAAGESYTPTELEGFASARAEAANVFTRLDALALTAMTPVFNPADEPPLEQPTDDQAKFTMMANIDRAVADVSSTFTRFQMEYEAREKAAQAYKDAGYTGDPTTWITSFATSVDMPAKQATDLILAQASQLREAIRLLGSARMGKYKIQTAADMVEARATYDAIMAQIATISQNLP
jgi:hypothetical protein